MNEKESKHSPSNESGGAIRVMIVGDTGTVGHRAAAILEGEPDINIVTTAPNGTAASIRLRRAAIDVVILDIGLPKRDGLKTLPKLLEIEPDVMVVMVSTLTFSNVKTSMEGLLAGAAEYLPIPLATRKKEKDKKEAEFRRELLEKVRTLGAPRKVSRNKQRAPLKIERDHKPDKLIPKAPRGPIKLRQPSKIKPEIIVFGSSTGGPKALFSSLAGLPKSLKQPILITQHMPPTFTTILAQNIAKSSGRACREAQDGEEIIGGNIYLAPGDFHMVVENRGGKMILRLNTDPPINFCRPAVDPMFTSAAKAYGNAVLAVILTGMGADGRNGAKDIVEAGGTVITQDEKTSVVWGMPAAAAEAG
ncbi:MAG: chemotaxis-specific protein-glutamate methyltransferase CheB, partial [Rhodospirillales bacterium]